MRVGSVAKRGRDQAQACPPARPAGALLPLLPLPLPLLLLLLPLPLPLLLQLLLQGWQARVTAPQAGALSGATGWLSGPRGRA